ncbi:hypothetical protein CesoFtcFv8_009078 [Champsocephalus esox]|uniref:Uncharacterized protein n=1 Tax=Champsocephalus esox TaxID=159716 RepID=A0AAN8H289_9TELE|nr:hypothetical protein CesoFtcFv8_009078 [Champsocephalus esox]
MQLLCIVALLLAAVAAQPPAGRRRLGADSKRGDDELLVTQAPEDGCGSGEESGRPSWAPGFMSDVSGVPHHRFGRHRGHRGPSRGHRPNRRNPAEMVFSPSFKVDNVTFQNTTDVSLKEGENIFLAPKQGRRGPHHHRGGRHGPPQSGQYVKLIYNATQPNMVSIEFGVFKPITLVEYAGEDENPEDDF